MSWALPPHPANAHVRVLAREIAAADAQISEVERHLGLLRHQRTLLQQQMARVMVHALTQPPAGANAWAETVTTAHLTRSAQAAAQALRPRNFTTTSEAKLP